MVSTTDDLKDILFGKGGVLTGNARPKRVVDMSSISDSGSAEIRKGLTDAGVAYLSAPVSGNAKVAKAGKLLVVASGSEGRNTTCSRCWRRSAARRCMSARASSRASGRSPTTPCSA